MRCEVGVRASADAGSDATSSRTIDAASRGADPGGTLRQPAARRRAGGTSPSTSATATRIFCRARRKKALETGRLDLDSEHLLGRAPGTTWSPTSSARSRRSRRDRDEVEISMGGRSAPSRTVALHGGKRVRCSTGLPESRELGFLLRRTGARAARARGRRGEWRQPACCRALGVSTRSSAAPVIRGVEGGREPDDRRARRPRPHTPRPVRPRPHRGSPRGKLDPVIGVQEEIEQTLELL